LEIGGAGVVHTNVLRNWSLRGVAQQRRSNLGKQSKLEAQANLTRLPRRRKAAPRNDKGIKK
jgi:hypothetical protein